MEVHKLSVTTADGVALEAELTLPDGEPSAAALLAHPHPRFGGSMHTPVPIDLARLLPAGGVAAMRFNFRGVGSSGGRQTGGPDEKLDVAACLGALHSVLSQVPLVAVGWSFGADVSLTSVDEHLAGWCCVAAPLEVFPADAYAAGADPRPKLMLVPEHDQYCPPDRARARTAAWSATTLTVLAGADHFFRTGAADVAPHVLAFAATL